MANASVSRISGFLMAAAMMAAGMPAPVFAQQTQDNANPTATNGQMATCFDPNTRAAPRRIRNITRDSVTQIYSSCLDAENWVEAVGMLASPEFDLGPNRWHAIDQLLAIYDGKVEHGRELNARLQDDARNPETGRRYSGDDRRDFQANLLQNDAWLRTVNRNVNVPAFVQWRNANAPIVQSITPIAGTQCQNEVRVTFNLQESFMTCGTRRAPALGRLQYDLRVNFQLPPPASMPAQP